MSQKSLLLISMLVIVATITCSTSAASNFSFAELRRCAKVSVQRTCNNNLNLIRDRLETVVNCGESEAARFAANYCAKDEEADLYCGAAVTYSLDISTALFTCGASLHPVIRAECSNACRSSLLEIRSNLGCCINAFYNNSQIYALVGPVLSYSLWSSCNVDPPSSTCEGAQPFTLPNSPQQTCTYTENAGCRDDDIDEIREFVMGEPSCELYLQYNIEACSLDANSEACALGLGTDIVSLSTVSGNCNEAQSCSSVCQESLQDFVNRRGCCVNTIYNSTFGQATGLNASAPFFQDRSIFELCGIELPSIAQCTSGSLPLRDFTFMMFLLLISIMILAS